ncbi:JAB domain-containing protein [Jeotgalibacillus sp. JSM ZJ347]|uniref:JAB domain-containing protein n=1 Tax=Jeotgalibacillus sp. JSM ZJ347 TaxID=3342117 RepID=UPI0035A9141B
MHPRKVLKSAILSNAASLLVEHNHPSGEPSPSIEDINVTERLKEAEKIVGIDLLDHIIIGENKFISLKEKGYL